MPGFLPNEGETFIANMVIKNITTDRGTDLSLILFTNSSVSETTAAADLTQPTSTNGYAAITLTDASWTVTGDNASYAKQTFTATGGSFSAPIYGYAILTKGSTPRIIAIEVDSGGPYALQENDTYEVTPVIKVA